MEITPCSPLSTGRYSTYFAHWSMRHAIPITFLAIVAVSAFLLFEYASYLTGGQGDYQDYDESKRIVRSIFSTIYLQFQPTSKASVSRKLKPSLPLPSTCLDAHIAKGELCFNPTEPKLDVLWTWVNGTDEFLRDAKARIENELPSDDPYRPYRPDNTWNQVRQFRDNDELRFSTRSVLAYFRPYTDRFHILTSDFKVPHTYANHTVPLDYRLGLVPQWLSPDNEWTDGNVRLSIKHHADIFNPYIDTVFNSYAIEAQFGHLTDISENFIYLNDDFFFFNDLTPRSFYTSAYGLVFRLQINRRVPPTPDGIDERGQWRSLATSNNLLSNRFGVRARPYISHQAKGASLPILHEISTIWPTQFANTATHPFRETSSGDSDPSMMFMLVHFVIERWREGLLWSWVIGKHGGLDDSWTQTVADGAWKELGGQPDHAKIDVRARLRETMNPDRVEENLRTSGHDQVDGAKYQFSSQDGYPYATIEEGVQNEWAVYHGVDEESLPRCSIDYEMCFTDDGKLLKSVSEVFKRITFKRPQCGDCITVAIVAASGELGLEKFLPSPDRIIPGMSKLFVPQEDEEDVPHLPLTDRWEDGQFALADVVGSHRRTNVREWTLKLLQRYRFMIDDTPSLFAMITRPSYLRLMMFQLKIHPEIALICVNDDISVDEENTSKQFKTWAQQRWGNPAQWERRP